MRPQPSSSPPVRSTPDGKPQSAPFPRPGSLAGALAFVLAFAFVALTHLTLLHLPYFWDEGGYYVPAALDFYRSGTLIPTFTNAHPPLPNVVLGTLWHVFGVHILVTRLTACAFAALALAAVYLLGRRLLSPLPALVLALLTAIYPIWFAQSSLAHADIFAAAFTLGGVALFLTSPELIGSFRQTFSRNSHTANKNNPHRDLKAQPGAEQTAFPAGEPPAAEHLLTSPHRLAFTAVLFCLSVLAKETAIVQPATLLAAQLAAAWFHRNNPARRRAHLRWSAALAAPIPVLAAWYAFHHARTGFTFGNPVFLRYNATANFTVAHIAYALRIRFVHLFWQRNLWLPLLLAAACLLLPSREPDREGRQLLGLPAPVTRTIALLVAANLLAFSVLGGALLTRYLLPVYPLLLLIAVALWRDRTAYWPGLAALSAAAFLTALWINPETFFAPEDNLTYRDMIVVQQHAIDFLNRKFPNATVLTAWPVSADLTRPELGYTTHIFHVDQIDNFTTPELTKAAQTPGAYDTALVFTTHYASPAFRRFLLAHPNSWRSRHYAADIDLMPAQIAQQLGGEVVWQENRYGEWAAILRFPRSYNAAVAH